jgi:hypothetical protein
MKNNVAQASTHFRHLEPGTRNMMLYLAQNHPTPTVSAARSGRWSPQRYFYGYYDEALVSRPKKYFKVYEQSKKYHYRGGFCADKFTVKHDGPITAKEYFCACPSCALPLCDFNNCKLKSLTGSRMSFHCPSIKPPDAVTTRLGSLAEFSKTIKKSEYRAVKVERDQQGIEGPYWLANVLGDAYQAPEDVTYAGDEIEKGSWVVKIRWLECDNHAESSSSSTRLYRKTNSEAEVRLLYTNALVKTGPVDLKKNRAQPRKLELLDSERMMIEQAM